MKNANNSTQPWQLTSIKVLSEIYSSFKVDGRSENVTLQKLVNRAMYLYSTNEEFRNKIKEVETLSENYKTGY
tara:strand:- start:1829 stop:2047 length:219 start_codon:yes stop_codon:yes gene_type:complete